ncbi:RNA polymerase sigma factor [Roseobacter weihaiensis]|uniref:RNA polymerase sigma factor n=1 Tax=Roseobacter weihaiensis TaxID=2763262 RepID=UPI001D0ABCBF|nr:RNA polymerase sigma factor [Roseobacter sp. H9]
MHISLGPEADLPDETLLQHYAAGDGRAATTLTARLLPRVYRHARRLLGEDSEAEDVAQDAMMRLWRIAPDWRCGEAQVTTWLYRVTANLCVDRLRRRRGVTLDDIAEPLDDGPSVLEQIQDRTRIDALQDALDQLPVRQRAAVVLRHIEGLSNPQIAEAMDISPRAVESLTARGKRALAEVLHSRRADLGYENDAE